MRWRRPPGSRDRREQGGCAGGMEGLCCAPPLGALWWESDYHPGWRSCTVNKLHVSLLQAGQAWGRGKLRRVGRLLPLVCSNPECLGHHSKVVAQRTFSICLKSELTNISETKTVICAPASADAAPGTWVLFWDVCCWAFLRDRPQSP